MPASKWYGRGGIQAALQRFVPDKGNLMSREQASRARFRYHCLCDELNPKHKPYTSCLREQASRGAFGPSGYH
jgi:hypothetical protein